MCPTHYCFIAYNIGFACKGIQDVCTDVWECNDPRLPRLNNLLDAFYSAIRCDVFPAEIGSGTGSDPIPISLVKGEDWGLGKDVELPICYNTVSRVLRFAYVDKLFMLITESSFLDRFGVVHMILGSRPESGCHPFSVFFASVR